MQVCQVIEKLIPQANSTNYEVIVFPDGHWEITKWNLTVPQPTLQEITAQWNLMSLDDAKQKKMKELNDACSQAILSRFSSTVNGITYYFSNDYVAQSNFKDAKDAWTHGYIPSTQTIRWTAYDSNGNVMRLDLSQTQFDTINIARMTWQQSNVARLRDTLQPQVNTASTQSDLDKIKW
jgi:YHS domain-containing protein